MKQHKYSDKAIAAQFVIDALVRAAREAQHLAEREPEALAQFAGQTFAEGSPRPARIATYVSQQGMRLAERLMKLADVDDLSAFPVHYEDT